MPSKRAFTLIELLVVVSVLMLLIGLLMPSIKMARETARRAICLSQMRQNAVATIAYVDDTYIMPGGRPHSPSHPYDRHVYREYSSSVVYRGWPIRFRGRTGIGVLFPDYVIDPHIYFCPSVGPTYESDFKFLSIEDELIPRVRGEHSGYEVVSTYFYRKKADIRRRESMELHKYENRGLALLLDAVYADIAPPNHADGFNVLHFDGHGRWQHDERNSLYVRTGTPYSSYLIETAIRLADQWASPTSSGGDQF